MKKGIQVLILTIFSCSLFMNVMAQQHVNPDYVYQDSEVDSVPEFKGGKQAMMNHIQNGIKDIDARGCTGMLVVSFIVEMDGTVSTIKILRSLCEKADNAVLEAVKSMPVWKPGVNKGQDVRVKINMPVRFLLPANENE